MLLKRFLLAGLAVSMTQGAANAQLTQAPAAPADGSQWHSVVYADLSTATSSTAAYSQLWAEEIAQNDSSYVAQGDLSYQGRHAPAIEAHFVVRSPEKIAVVSMLNTTSGCSVKSLAGPAGITVKLCPLKLAIYEGGNKTVTTGFKACFLEMQQPSSDPTGLGTFASYDIAHRAIRIGTLIGHEPVPGCGKNIGLYQSLPQ